MKLVVNKYNNEVYSTTDDTRSEIVDIREAFNSYSDDLELVINNKKNFPENADYWQEQIEHYRKILKAGFEVITYEEYIKREKVKWLNKEPREITEDEYNYALNVLPPYLWENNGSYSMFFISEATHLSFHAQYIYVKPTGKYYTAIADVLDKSTWLNKLLNL